MSHYKFETLQLHVGQEQPDPATDARAVPIYATTSYVFRNCEHAAARFGLTDAGNIYGRLTNSTQDVLEKRIAALEGGVAALAVASGAAAIDYVLQALGQNGGHFVAQKTIYGGSYNLLEHTLPGFGITATFVNIHDLDEVEKAIRPNTRAIYIETLGNPNSDIPDIDALAALAHKYGLPLVVDNTFGTPYLIRPIEYGADIVVHSATKFLGDAMEPALANEEFLVYLQPKYSLKQGCIAGAEALVRWIHPQWGFMSPGEFIPLFEKNGFIPRLDRYMWDKVCRLLGQWKREGHPMIPISVNVSRADIFQQDLVKTLTGLTEKYDVEPKYLHLEITESAYVNNASRIVEKLKELRQLGFPIEMDDFGSGYSSLNMLGQLRMDVLKLDMQFVRNETGKPEDRSILRDIVTMGHRLGLGIVAEGAETQQQVERLKAAGCDYVQGYFFAKPMPLDQFEEHWKAQNYARVNPEEK